MDLGIVMHMFCHNGIAENNVSANRALCLNVRFWVDEQAINLMETTAMVTQETYEYQIENNCNQSFISVDSSPSMITHFIDLICWHFVQGALISIVASDYGFGHCHTHVFVTMVMQKTT